MHENMTLSPAGRQFLKNEEGNYLYIYDDMAKNGKDGRKPIWRKGDPVHGTLTIGVGHALKKGDKWVPGVIYTQAQIDAQLESDLQWVYAIIRKCVKVPLTQQLFDMLVSLILNIGPGFGIKGLPKYKPGFTNSTLLIRLNQKAPEAMLVEAWRRWRFSNNEPVLFGRRCRETTRAFAKSP